jgi:hypothetical protein
MESYRKWKECALLGSVFYLFLLTQVIMQASALAEVARRQSSAIYHGVEAMRRLKQEARRSANPLHSRSEFIDFMTQVVSRKLTDKEFAAKVALRDLRREHREKLELVEGAYHKALDEFNTLDVAVVLAELDKRIKGGSQAVESMSKFVNSEGDDHGAKNAERIANCKALLPEKIRQLEEDIEAREELRKNTTAYITLAASEQWKLDVYSELGLIEREELVKKESKGSGTGRNTRGRDFEAEAFKSLEEVVVPKVSTFYGVSEEELLCVRNIKFGMASAKGSTAEIDSLVCRRMVPTDGDDVKDSWSKRGTPVEVLAVCEVKRNADDCGDAFAGYQPSLRWLCGLRDEYDPAIYVTKSFPSGHFDRPYLHQLHSPAGSREGIEIGGNVRPEVLVFTEDSFRRMRDERAVLPIAPAEATAMGVLPMLRDREGDGGGSVDGVSGAPSDEETVEVSLFLSSLFFICRGGKLDCVTSKAMAWATSKCAADVRLGPGSKLLCGDDDDDLEEGGGILRLEALTEIMEATKLRYPPRMSTMDLLKLLETEGLFDQMVVIA